MSKITVSLPTQNIDLNRLWPGGGCGESAASPNGAALAAIRMVASTVHRLGTALAASPVGPFSESDRIEEAHRDSHAMALLSHAQLHGFGHVRI